MKLLLSLLLLSSVGVGDVVAIRFPRLDTPLAQVVFVVLGAASIALVWWIYRREAAYVSTKRKRLLASLRTGAVLVILFICTGAFAELNRAQDGKGRLLLLFDDSRSMGISDKRSRPDELAEARRLMPNATEAEASSATRDALLRGAFTQPDTDLVGQVGDKFGIEAYSFGQGQSLSPMSLSPIDAEGGRLSALSAPEEGATQLGDALADAVRRAKGRTLDGIVVFSDGGWNRGEDPVETARSLGVPIHTVGVGLPRSRDLEVAFVFCDDVVFKNDRVRIETRLRSYGYDGKVATLRIIRVDEQGTEEVLKEEQVELGNGGELTRYVEVLPDREGMFTFVAELVPFPDEPNILNNRRARSNVRVLDRKIALLMVEDAPRWEFRFIKGVAEADRQRMQVTSILRQADEKGVGARVLRHFPGTLAELRRYDCIIIGDMLVEFFTPEELRVLEEWVRIEGGGLCLIAGRKGMPSAYAGTPIETLMPVECEAIPLPSVQEEMTTTISTGFHPERTPDGKRTPALRLAGDDVEDERQWSEASEMFWVAPVRRLKSGATAWMVHPDRELADGSKMPVMAAQRYGKGQVVFLASDETWRWRFHPGAAQHRRIWGQMISSLAMGHLLGGSSRTQLAVDKTEIGVGERVQILARVLDQDYNPLLAENMVLEVEQGVTREQVMLASRRDQPGVFSGEWVAPAEGRYRLRVEGVGGDPGDERAVDVVPSRLELDDSGMREDLLRQIAQVSGGTYTPLAEVASLTEILKSHERTGAVRREERTLWNAPGVMILLALLLGLEWFFRKRSDLL